MTHDVANKTRFQNVIDLCDGVDEFIGEHEDTEDVASQQMLSAIAFVVSTVLHSIWQGKHDAVTIDARLGVDGHDAAPIYR